MSDVTSLAGNSRLVCALERGFERIAAAWTASATRRRIAAATGGPQADAVHLVRIGGWAVLSATVVHALLVGFDHLLAPPLTGVGWIAAIPFAVVSIVRPQAVVAAWHSRRRRNRSTAR